jgi:Branched-chain amino acid transport protein (AzlD)
VTWTALIVLAAATYSLRVAGLVLRDRLRLPARVERYVDLGATALLVALVTVSTLADGDAFAGWARAGGRPGGRSRSVATRAVRPRRAARGGDDGGPARARRAVTQPLGATSYRARLRVNDAVPDVIARRSTA